MKINLATDNEVKFIDIMEGEIFKFLDSFYIKTQYEETEDGWINAVDLEDGALCGFDGEEKVFCYPNANINLM